MAWVKWENFEFGRRHLTVFETEEDCEKEEDFYVVLIVIIMPFASELFAASTILRFCLKFEVLRSPPFWRKMGRLGLKRPLFDVGN